MKQPDFSMAKFLLGVTSFVGVICLALGVLAGGAFFAMGDTTAALVSGGGAIAGGVVIIAMAQMSRAVIATAETSHAILIELKAARSSAGAGSSRSEPQ